METHLDNIFIPIWLPFPDSPQERAYYSEADELFYGGAAGGGKTDLLLGLAGTSHQTSIIFRREFPRLRAITERSREIYNAGGDSHAKDSYNESLHIWRLLDGKVIEFGSVQYEKNKINYQGRPHDLYCFDEITEFTEDIYRFIKIWNRSTKPNQRCRMVVTGNPPTDAAGEWVIQYWAAWLDDQHPNPAKDGELRWYASIDGKEIEVDSGEPILNESPANEDDKYIYPLSRTFIHARVEDNPVLMKTGYKAGLQAISDPTLRQQMLYGDFSIGLQDDAWQVIPTEWVKAANKRWDDMQRPDVKCRSVGVDPSRGGKDEFIIAKLYANYFDDIIAHTGVDSSNGEIGANHIHHAIGEENPLVFIDAIGIGASVYDYTNTMMPHVHAVNVGSKPTGKDKTGRYEFSNLRSETWWRFREALDPSSGENIALPPIRSLRVDLSAPRYFIRAGKIAIESKKDIKKRIGRSTDYADAVLLAWHGANKPERKASYIQIPDIYTDF